MTVCDSRTPGQKIKVFFFPPRYLLEECVQEFIKDTFTQGRDATFRFVRDLNCFVLQKYMRDET